MNAKPVRLVAVTGALRRPSRTAALLGDLVERLTRVLVDHGLSPEVRHVDCLQLGGRLFAEHDAALDEAVATACNADLLVLGSPTYQGTCTGLLKSFLDRFPRRGLAESTVIPLLTFGDPAHASTSSAHLTTVLTALAARLPGPPLAVHDAGGVLPVDACQLWTAAHLEPLLNSIGPSG